MGEVAAIHCHQARFPDTTMTYNDRNDMIRDLCAGTLELDKLQVELSADSPYKTPSAEESRARILKAMNKLQSVYNLLENQKCED